MSEFLTTDGSSPLEIHRRLRSVYGEDATDVGSVDAGPVVLRTVKRDFGYRSLSNRQTTAATSGRVKLFGRGATVNSELCIQILKKLEQIRRVRPNMKTNKFRSCMTTPACTPYRAQGRQLQQWCVMSPSSSLQSRFSTHRLPHFWTPVLIKIN